MRVWMLETRQLDANLLNANLLDHFIELYIEEMAAYKNACDIAISLMDMVGYSKQTSDYYNFYEKIYSEYKKGTLNNLKCSLQMYGDCLLFFEELKTSIIVLPKDLLGEDRKPLGEVLAIRKETPCLNCGRKNDIGVAECWCCGIKNPTNS
jgi:hypothetical protein